MASDFVAARLNMAEKTARACDKSVHGQFAVADGAGPALVSAVASRSSIGNK